MVIRARVASIWHRRTPHVRVACLQVVLLYHSTASAIDLEAGAYTALAPGRSALAVYVQHVERDARYVDGMQLPGDVRLDTNALQARFLQYQTYRGQTVAPGFIVSCGNTDAGGDIAALGTARGCADPIVGAAVWTVNRPRERRYHAITPYLSVPVGNYAKDKILNLGENRWRLGLNSGVITPLLGKFLLDLVADVVWHGGNDDYLGDQRLDQDAILNAQIHLRYQIDPVTRWSVSYLHDWGGETTVDGIAQQKAKNQGRYRIGTARFLNPNHQLQLEAGADGQVENGYRESARFLVRYVWLN